jgi:hypothetical protein
MKDVKERCVTVTKAIPSIRVPIQTGARRAEIPTEHAEVREILKWAELAKNLPVVRRDLVDSVKAQIAAGTYDTSDKLEAAIDRMLQDLD